jgi:hypothetical protein
MRILMNDMVAGARKSLAKRIGLCGVCALVVAQRGDAGSGAWNAHRRAVGVRHRVALILPQPVPRRPAC